MSKTQSDYDNASNAPVAETNGDPAPEVAKPSRGKGRRFHELDAIRGLAALSVVFHHYAMAFPALYKTMIEPGHPLSASPLHAIWSGSQAVVLFFVLSGFVLKLPFEARSIPYGQFALKRIVRIYLPYLAAIALALVLSQTVYKGSVAGMSDWFNHPWSDPVSASMILNHVILLGSFTNNALIPVVWSLVFEMRISLFFPALIKPLKDKSLGFGLALATGLYALGFVLEQVAKKFTGKQQDYTETVAIAALFLLGSVLAQHREVLSQKLSKLFGGKPIVLWIVALMLYTAPHWGYKIPRAFWAIFERPVVGLGCAMFILLALREGRASTILRSKVCTSLGAWSYSLYLVHTVVLLAFVHLFASTLGAPLSAAIGLAVTIPFAWLFFTVVEKPSTVLSQRIRL